MVNDKYLLYWYYNQGGFYLVDECGNYFIEDMERLGRGGFGEVFKVNVYNRTKDHCTSYARKYFSPSPDNDNTHIREIADLRQRFLVEINTQCKLNSLAHDLIAPIVLFNKQGDMPYFVMELAKDNLRNLIVNMSDSDRRKATLQILQGVRLIHQNNYIHRDLKPENILVYEDKKHKISDFGLVKDMDTVRAEVKTKFKPNAIGSDGYRAPEIRDSGTFSQQSDIFAVGKIINDIYLVNCPVELRPIISKCTSHWPEDRYESIDDLLNALAKLWDGLKESA